MLKLGATAAVGTAAGFPAVSTARAELLSTAKPKNIIFMVSDGMSMGVPTLAEAFSRLLGSGETNWHKLARDPRTVRGYFDMASLDSLVTDSSAASTSWGSGSRIFNHSINMLPDGTALQPIAVSVKESGRSMGLVTTATITHATPAGFAASVFDRDNELDIAPQYLDHVDVLLGGGLDFFNPQTRKDQRDLLAEYKKAGYYVLTSRDQMVSDKGWKKMLGLFDNRHLPFTLDWNFNADVQKRVPRLAQMSTFALQSLQQNAKGFLVQIEGARIDHAGHSNDPAAILWDQLAFDEAIGVVLTFVRDNPDTLVVITTDHGNSNPGLNGMGNEYAQSNQTFARLKDFRASSLLMQSDLQNIIKLNKTLKPEDVLARVKSGTGLTLSPAEGAALVDALSGTTSRLGNQQHNGFCGLLGEFTGNHTGIGWTGTSHTADYVPILAFGPGAEAFQGLVLNTDAYPRMTAMMGVTHKNPSMTPEQASKYLKVANATAYTTRPHWLS